MQSKRIKKMAEEVKAGRTDLLEQATVHELSEIASVLEKQKALDTAAVRKSDRESTLRQRREEDPRPSALIVQDVLNPPSQSHWQAVLEGKVLATSVASGPTIAFLPATQTQRVIWLTDRFVQDHIEIARLVAAECQKRGSKWSLGKDRQHFLDRAAKVKSQAVLLLADHEKHLEATRNSNQG